MIQGALSGTAYRGAAYLRLRLPLRCPLPARARAPLPAARSTQPTEPLTRFFTTSAPLPKNPLPSRPKPPPEDEIEEVFVKGSGPGGQKINKTNSAVQIKHLPTGIVVKSQATRSRSENRAIARKVLAQRLDELYNGVESRTAIVGDLKRKKRASSDKKSRRKYRKLEEERQGDSISASLEEEGADFVARDMAYQNLTETKGQENPTRSSDEALKPTSVASREAAKPTCPRE